jgi:phenylacetate-CoA ligase
VAKGRGTRRLADFGRALTMGRRELAGTARLGTEALRARQNRMLADLVRHAVTASPLYRDLYAGADLAEPDLASLPPVTKAQLMERFDDWVTDPRLKLVDLERHIDGLSGDDLHLDRYRVVASSGSTGRRGVFVYSRADWLVNLANFGRLNEQFAGIHPRLPRRLRVAAVSATSPLHISARTSLAMAVGVNRVLRLDARQPLAELAGVLRGFRPEVLVGYPSALALLADEQLAGRLDLRPEKVVTVSEVRTPEMADAIREAWGVQPFDWYGITEGGVLAGDCEHHRGMHLLEDLFVVENVDEAGRAVPDGEVGHKLLLTNLFNRTQPVIRYELSDMVAIDPTPCPCGRHLRRVVALDGRSDDILRLPGIAGGHVRVHPITLRSPFAHLAGVRQYRVVQDVHGLHALVVPRREDASDEVVRQVGEALAAALTQAGASPSTLRIEVVRELGRDQGHGAKYKLVESR